MTEAPDATLVAQVLAGDTGMFGHLVDRYQDQMLSYVIHMGFSEAEALDVVQESLVRAFRHLARCGDPDRFDGWLFRIVSNVCKTHKSREARRRTERLEAHRGLIDDAGPGPDEAAEASWTRERVRRALDAIAHDQREALVLMYLQGLSVSEICDVTGVSASAVKMRLKRGREALRHELEPLFEEVRER